VTGWQILGAVVIAALFAVWGAITVPGADGWRSIALDFAGTLVLILAGLWAIQP
jgi:uncharacterized membrane protein